MKNMSGVFLDQSRPRRIPKRRNRDLEIQNWLILLFKSTMASDQDNKKKSQMSKFSLDQSAPDVPKKN